MLETYTSEGPVYSRSQRLIFQLQDTSAQEEAFRQVFHEYYRPVLLFFIKRGIFTFPECEELTQETFLRVFRGRATFRQEVSFKYWIFSISANVYRSALESRSAAKRRGREISLETERGEKVLEGPKQVASNPDSSPLERLLEEEQLAMLRHAMDELPYQMRRCMTLRIGSGLRYREIAEVMQISIQTVKAHLSQGREKLKSVLSTRLDNPRQEVVRE